MSKPRPAQFISQSSSNSLNTFQDLGTGCPFHPPSATYGHVCKTDSHWKLEGLSSGVSPQRIQFSASTVRVWNGLTRRNSGSPFQKPPSVHRTGRWDVAVNLCLEVQNPEFGVCFSC